MSTYLAVLAKLKKKQINEGNRSNGQASVVLNEFKRIYYIETLKITQQKYCTSRIISLLTPLDTWKRVHVKNLVTKKRGYSPNSEENMY